MDNLKNEKIESELYEILESAKNLVSNSEHYSGKIETIDYIQDKLTEEQFQGYLFGNIFKYLSRYNKKGQRYLDLNKGFIYFLWLLKSKFKNKEKELEGN